MKTKIVFIILFTVISIFAYAKEIILDEFIKDMVDSIKVENSRCITIPGKKGALRIYIESYKSKPHSLDLVVIDYNGNKTPFQAGNNFLVTQDDKLVFGKYNGKIYAKANDKPNKEYLKIKHNHYLYDYTGNNIKIAADDEKFTAEEVLYNKDNDKFTVYENRKAVKQIELK